MSEDIEPQAQAWAAGKMTIVAILDIGPHAGEAVMCITGRRLIRNTIKDFQRGGLMPDWKISLMKAIREVVTTEAEWAADDPMSDFMDDLAILMALRTAGDPDVDDAGLQACGIRRIGFTVSSDVRLPWHKRGFLSARDAKNAIMAPPIQ